MNNTGKTIVKNASFLMFSQMITWGMALLLTAFLPRYLGAVGMGKLQLALSLWAIMGVIVSFGMDTFLTKKIARNPENVGNLFSSSIVLRTLLFGLSLIGMAVYTQIAGYPADTTMVIFVIGIASLIGQYSSTCQSALNGLERMEYVSISDIVSKGVTTLISIGLLLMGYHVMAIAFVYILGNMLSFSIQFLALRRKQKLHLHRFNWQSGIEILKHSFPFLLMGGFLVFYAQVDVVIISLLVSEEQLGWYGAADRLFATLLFIPTVYMMAVFPALSRMHVEASQSIKNLSSLSFDLLLLMAVPIGLGLMVIANQLVLVVFGADFANSGPILAIFGVVLIMTYLNILIGSFLIATDRQNPWTRVIIIATLISIPLDLILIPWCERIFSNGAIGGALAFVVTEAFMLIAGIRLLPKGTLTQVNLSYALRTLLAGAIMVVSIWWIRDMFLPIPILVGTAVYLICIISMKLITPEVWKLVKNMVTTIEQRLGINRAQPAAGNTTK